MCLWSQCYGWWRCEDLWGFLSGSLDLGSVSYPVLRKVVKQYTQCPSLTSSFVYVCVYPYICMCINHTEIMHIHAHPKNKAREAMLFINMKALPTVLREKKGVSH